jgi:outer membrane lipoprotein
MVIPGMIHGTTPGTIPGIAPGHVATTGIIPITIATENTMSRLLVYLSFITLLLLTGCASSPKFDNARYDTSIQPNQVAESFASYQHKTLLWGGRIVSVANLSEGTQLEVLGHPLTDSQMPNTNQTSTGRFLVFSKEFLEPLDFTEGRLITVAGPIEEVQNGRVGAVDYQYPVLNSEEIYLWSGNEIAGNPRVHVGFGFLFGN